MNFIREPMIMGDPNIWARYENSENRKSIGTISSYLYTSGELLYLARGKIGINDNTVRGTIIIDTNTLIPLAGLTKENWIKIEITVSNVSINITATNISGETNRNSIPSEFENAYDYEKNGYYISTDRRCIGLV